MKGKNFSCNNTGKRLKSDNYQTPYSMTAQLFENEIFDYKGLCLEPAPGKGAMIKIMTPFFKEIIAPVGDFSKHWYHDEIIHYIITNPPYSLAEKFIRECKRLYKVKMCFLLRLNFLHGQRRYKEKIFSELSRVYIFTRYPMLTDTVRPDGKYNTGMIAYAWYVWEKGYTGEPAIRWIDNDKYILRKR